MSGNWKLTTHNSKLITLPLLLIASSSRGQEYPVVEVVEIRGHAEVFPKFCTGHQWRCSRGRNPGFRVGLWIRNRDLGFKCGVVHSPPPFNDFQLIAVSPAAIRRTFIDPGSFVITVR